MNIEPPRLGEIVTAMVAGAGFLGLIIMLRVNIARVLRDIDIITERVQLGSDALQRLLERVVVHEKEDAIAHEQIGKLEYEVIRLRDVQHRMNNDISVAKVLVESIDKRLSKLANGGAKEKS